ncbi:MAG TPA: sulfurtransferase [Nevskiaceae bacterium]
MDQPFITPAVTADALSERLVVDCRFSLDEPGRGAVDYLRAHVPGAVYAHLDHDLADTSLRGQGRHPLPTAAAFAARLAGWGWRAGRAVIVYDDGDAPLAAARLWWMLRIAGVDAQVMNGGWRAWQAAGLPTESGPAQRHSQAPAALSFDAAATVGYEALEDPRKRRALLLLDARATPRFRGVREPRDPVAGHVPGAQNRPMSMNLDDRGRFKPAAALRAEFDALLGPRRPADVVHMCGSGVSACQNQLAMELAGLHGSRVFVPSWSGWCSDPRRPVATGA